MKPECPIFMVAADSWRDDVLSLNRLHTYQGGKNHIKLLNDDFAHRKANTITKQDIQKFIVKHSQHAGAKYLRDVVQTLRKIVEYVDEDWEMPRRLKFPKASKPSRGFYTFDEVRKLIHFSDGMPQTLIMTLAETGCRFGESLALQSGDLQNGKISITKTVINGFVQDTPKTDSAIRKVNISPRLEAALKYLITGDSRQFFFRTSQGRPMWPQAFVSTFRKICSHAQVEHKAQHAFRRGNVRELILNLKIPEKIVAARIGHKCSDKLILGVYCPSMEDDDLPYVSQIEKWLYEGMK